MISSHPSNFDLDRLLAGEPDAEGLGSLQEHVDQCTACSTYLSERKQEQVAQMKALAPQVFAAQVEERCDKRAQQSPVAKARRYWQWGLAGALSVALMVAGLQLFTVFSRTPLGDVGRWFEVEDIRWMGGSSIVELQVRRDGELVEKSPIRAGDQVRYRVTIPPGATGYAMVVGVEGSRVFSLLPEDGVPARIEDVEWIPGSVAFDPGGVVRLLVFVRRTPFTAEELLTEVRQGMSRHEPLGPLGLAFEHTVDLDD